MIRLSSPTQKGFISSTWGRPRPHRGGWHEGVDLFEPKGSPVLAAADGEVIKVDNVDNSGAGKHIVIHHGGGIHSRYLHNDKNLVSRGQRVNRGQKIATVGTTGTKHSGPHLHFDLKFQDSAHAAYEARYGMPKTGWGPTMGNLGRGVPAETFLSGVSYDAGAKQQALDLGVKFYKSNAMLVLSVGAIALGTYWLLK
jgi:murein DD-endopeptidase MepM/ murein hydrolase activator NlpD